MWIRLVRGVATDKGPLCFLRSKKYEQLSTRALQEIVKEYPGTAEARSAEIILERLRSDFVQER
jgi:hypothetical protein